MTGCLEHCDDDDDDTWAGVDTVEDCETGEMSRPMVKTDTGIRRGIARHTTKHSNRSPETRDNIRIRSTVEEQRLIDVQLSSALMK